MAMCSGSQLPEVFGKLLKAVAKIFEQGTVYVDVSAQQIKMAIVLACNCLVIFNYYIISSV